MPIMPRCACVLDAPPGDEELKREILAYMATHSTIAKFALPTEVAFVTEIPHTATGKISKLSLRQQFKDYKRQAEPSNVHQPRSKL